MPTSDLKRRTKAFALAVIHVYPTLEKSSVGRVLGNQLLRSATSVGANYREAVRSRSNPEFISKVGDCLKELDETAYWLELSSESGVVPASAVEPLLDETDQLLAIFTTISKNVKARSRE